MNTPSNSDRAPCNACSILILPVTFKLNEGLCAQCVKGHRPCKYCGRHSIGPALDGTFYHMDCEHRNHQSSRAIPMNAILPQCIAYAALQCFPNPKTRKLFADLQTAIQNGTTSSTVNFAERLVKRKDCASIPFQNGNIILTQWMLCWSVKWYSHDGENQYSILDVVDESKARNYFRDLQLEIEQAESIIQDAITRRSQPNI